MDQATHHKFVSFVWCVADDGVRGTGKVPLLEDCGMKALIRHEVLPDAADVWVKEDVTEIACEISCHLHKTQPLLPLGQIRADIVAHEEELERALDERLKGVAA